LFKKIQEEEKMQIKNSKYSENKQKKLLSKFACSNHLENEAILYCKICKKFFCCDCRSDHEDHIKEIEILNKDEII
jgi:hypothetical protein